MAQMDQNGSNVPKWPKQPKVVQNSQSSPNGPNHSKWAKRPQMVQTAQNVPKWSKRPRMAQNGLTWHKGPKLPKIAQNGPEWTRVAHFDKYQHKNRPFGLIPTQDVNSSLHISDEKMGMYFRPDGWATTPPLPLTTTSATTNSTTTTTDGPSQIGWGACHLKARVTARQRYKNKKIWKMAIE